MRPAGPRTTATAVALLLMVSTGCQHARSFLHMNSDSPAPFLGLELSVDADPPTGATKPHQTSNETPISFVSGAGGRQQWLDSRTAAEDPCEAVVELRMEPPGADESATIDALLARFGH